MVKAPNISPVGLAGLKLGGYNAGKPGGWEAKKIILTKSFMRPDFLASWHSGFPAGNLIRPSSYYTIE
jgi:hypothetical protein